MANDLRDQLHQLGRPTILVVGDIMLDRYTFGFAERMSQEAPVPVFRIDRHEDRLGGAAGVAAMLTCLEAQVMLAGVMGRDATAQSVRELLRAWGLREDLIVTEPGRPTTRKERFIGRAQDRHPQQMFRVDQEVQDPLAAETEGQLRSALVGQLPSCDILLVSDYGKGVCTPSLLEFLIGHARACGKRVLIDPARISDYRPYRGATCLTPNRTEAQAATGLAVTTPDQALAAGEFLLGLLGAEAIVITLDKDGMALAHADGRRQMFPTRPRQVYDVTGAGDMVLSVLGLCLAAGLDYGPAIGLSNVAAGLEVERLGAVTISRTDLARELGAAATPRREAPWTREELVAELDRRRTQGQRIVFTNGCFDVLHAGHVECLRQARALGDLLVVAVNSDASVCRLKGPGRPLNTAAARVAVLSALACVDYVTVFDEDTPLSLIQAVRPHVLVKGGDYRLDEVVGREVVEAAGGRVAIVPFVPGYSTTELVRGWKNRGVAVGTAPPGRRESIRAALPPTAST